MRGKGIAFGAISIVNAIATGNGAALGTQLKTEAEVELIKN
ncbi:MAG: shikimate kinase, partial [archaeon]|nr:shikimate kinase [archaeon]